MHFQNALKKSGLVLLSILLSGCLSDGSTVFKGPLTTAQKPLKKHFASQGRKNTAVADNPATRDYFAKQPETLNESDNLWSDIRHHFQIDHEEKNPQVQAQIGWFLHNQSYLDRTARRAAPFMYYIYQEVNKHHLPSELVLLPILESAYNPLTSSSAGAAGLWQIVPGTGRNFGLKQNFWYDGRRDVKTSTKAALDYFVYLQNFFSGNWLLAIAAYDTGQGNVAAAVRRNARLGLPANFWSLRLARETQAYIPRLLALAVIVDKPEAFGIELPPISNTPYLGEVEISHKMTLEKVASLANINVNALKILNAGIRRGHPDPHAPYQLLLPIDRVSLFKKQLLGTQADEMTSSSLLPSTSTIKNKASQQATQTVIDNNTYEEATTEETVKETTLPLSAPKKHRSAPKKTRAHHSTNTPVKNKKQKHRSSSKTPAQLHAVAHRKPVKTLKTPQKNHLSSSHHGNHKSRFHVRH